MNRQTYNIIADRLLSRDLRAADVAKVALEYATPGRDVVILRARPGASAFERANCYGRRKALVKVAEHVMGRIAECSRAHTRELQAAVGEYGQRGPVISAVGQEHFPEHVKTRLRKLARSASAGGFVVMLLRRAGCPGRYRQIHDAHKWGFYGA